MDVDETGLRVEGAGRFVHVASTARLTHCACDSRRGKTATDEIGILPAFRGKSVHDVWPAYGYYYQCRHSLCGRTCCASVLPPLRRVGQARAGA